MRHSIRPLFANFHFKVTQAPDSLPRKKNASKDNASAWIAPARRENANEDITCPGADPIFVDSFNK